MELEVLVHEADRVRRIGLDLPETATVGDALAAAGLDEGRSEKVGIFGRLCERGETVSAGARIEVYRALVADPKQVRRQRARLRRPAG